MKFTKEQLSEALRVKLTPNGKKLAMSERTLNGNAERLYNRLAKDEANADVELADVVAEYLPDFEEINNNVRKDNADFAKAYEDDWKKAHPEDQKPAPKKDGGNEGDDDPMKALMGKLDALEQRLADADNKRVVADKRQQLIDSFKEKGIKDEKWLAGYMRKLSVNKDTDVEQETNDAIEFYNLAHAGTPAEETPGGAGGGSSDYSKDFEAIRKKREDAIKQERGESTAS